MPPRPQVRASKKKVEVQKKNQAKQTEPKPPKLKETTLAVTRAETTPQVINNPALPAPEAANPNHWLDAVKTYSENLDSKKYTCAEFTEWMISTALPDISEADPAWLHLALNLRTLLDELAREPAMAENLPLKFDAPPADQSRVYFMWRLVGRTLSLVYNTNPMLLQLSDEEQERWDFAQGRAAFAAALILDLAAPGELDMMVEVTYTAPKGQRRPLVDFGDKVMDVARMMWHTRNHGYDERIKEGYAWHDIGDEDASGDEK